MDGNSDGINEIGTLVGRADGLVLGTIVGFTLGNEVLGALATGAISGTPIVEGKTDGK